MPIEMSGGMAGLFGIEQKPEPPKPIAKCPFCQEDIFHRFKICEAAIDTAGDVIYQDNYDQWRKFSFERTRYAFDHILREKGSYAKDIIEGLIFDYLETDNRDFIVMSERVAKAKEWSFFELAYPHIPKDKMRKLLEG